MADDYIYQPKPLPPNTEFGGNAISDATVQINGPDAYPVASSIPADSPFQTPTASSSGGTTGTTSVFYVVIDGVLYTQKFIVSGAPVPVV